MNRIDTIDLNLLRDLVLLFDEGSVTAAAIRSGVTQSAMSHRLRRLREALGDPLFVTSPEGLSPTPRGEDLAAVARGVLTQLGEAIRPAEEFDPLRSDRHFRVATTDYAEFVVLPVILNRLRETGWRVGFSMPMRGPDDEGAMRRGEIDLVVGARGRFGGEVRSRVILRDGFEMAARSDHPLLAERDEIDLDTYLSVQHLQIAPDGAPGGPLDGLLAQRGLRRDVRLQVAHFVTAPFLLSASDYVLTAPTTLLAHAERYVSLRRWPLPFQMPIVDVCMFWHERFHRDPGHRWLRNFVLDVTADAHPNTP